MGIRTAAEKALERRGWTNSEIATFLDNAVIENDVDRTSFRNVAVLSVWHGLDGDHIVDCVEADGTCWVDN